MTNLVGTVTQADAAQAVREHRRRIRALEANQPGSQDGAWVTPTLLTGVDASTLGYPDAPVAYRQTNDGMIVMRGRIVELSASSAVVFSMPSGLQPAYDMTFVCDASGPAPLTGSAGGDAGGSASGLVRIGGDASPLHAGDVIVYLGGRAYAWAAMEPLVYGAIPLFVNTAGNDYTISSGFEILSGHTVASPPPGAVFYASGEYADGEVTVTVAAATELMIGARLQLAQVFASSGNLTATPVPSNNYQRWTPGTGDLSPQGGLPYPPGFWLDALPDFGDDWLLYHADPLLSDPVAGLQTVATFPGPGYSSGDTITLRVQGAGSFAVLKNGSLVWADRFDLADDGTGPTAGMFSSGWFGLGAQGSPSTVLASQVVFGPSAADGVSLTNVRYRIP